MSENMKCPYRNFKDCIVEKCPACNYEKAEEKVLEGNAPVWMSTEIALKRGLLWHRTKTVCRFISCKLVEGGVQPVPEINQTINNTSRSVSVVKKSIF